MTRQNQGISHRYHNDGTLSDEQRLNLLSGDYISPNHLRTCLTASRGDTEKVEPIYLSVSVVKLNSGYLERRPFLVVVTRAVPSFEG